MLKPHLSLAVCVYLAAAGAVLAQTSFVFQLPGQTGLSTQIYAVGDNNFARNLGPTSGPAAASGVLATPNGNKFYILSPSGIFSANATLGAQVRVAAVSGAVTAAEVTPDGKYLAVIADQFYMVNTANDALATGSNASVPQGASPVGLAVSHDSKTAWVVSNTTSGSTISALNLTTFQPVGFPVNLPFSAISMVQSSRGLLYVTATDRIYEIDPVSLSITIGGQIPVQGSAGPLQFTPDGTTAYFLFSHPCQSCPSVGKLNVQSHSVNSWPSDGSTPPTIDKILVAGNNRIFALSGGATTKLFDVTPIPLTLTPSSLGNLPTSNVVGAAVSNERSSARYLYVFVSDLNFYRVNLANNGIDGVSSLDPAKGTTLTFVSIPAPASAAASVFPINPTQNVVPGASTVLIGQVLDGNGRPVFGAQASFSSDCAGLSIASPSLVSTSEGWAQTIITAPAISGTCTVSLSSGAFSTQFQVTVGSGSTGGGGTPKISMVSGDGQLLKPNQSTLSIPLQPLIVKVTDAAGNPLENVQVTFQVTEGLLDSSVSTPGSGLTDKNGIATAYFTSGNLQFGDPYKLNKVTASSTYGSVEFYEVTRYADPLNNPHPPIIDSFKPENLKLTIPQGGFIAAGISARTLANNGTPQPIPNVGLRIADPNSISLVGNSDVAGCVSTSRGDNAGVSRCDVQAFCQAPGSIPPNGLVKQAIVQVGEIFSQRVEFTITNGTPSVLAKVNGDNQTGSPSDTFTLSAQVTDGCFQPSPGVSGLTWSIIQGTASFSQQQTTSDSSGNLFARVTLGSTAGTVKVQLAGPGLAPIIFNLTTQIPVSGITLVSGGGQITTVGQNFLSPVVFVARGAGGLPAPAGLVVNFSVTGSATINPASATTNAQGQVQTTVKAGPIAGTIVVTAAYNAFSATATLTSNLQGPLVTSTSFTNAASGAVGMTPCGLITVTGNGIAPNVTGVVSGITAFGPLNYSLAGVSITANNLPVPIQAVSNLDGVQRANFQAPCELTPGNATLIVTVNGAKTTVSGVPVFAVQPGIFTFAGPNNKVYGAVARPDGSYVLPSNPARQGETYFMFVTGLGQVTPAAFTNSVGTGSQTVNLPMIVGLSDRGVAVISARYLIGAIGAYVVEFQIPADSPLGPDQSLAVAAIVNDNFVFGNPVFLPAVVAP